MMICFNLQAKEFKWYDFIAEVPDDGFASTFVESFIETTHLVPDKDSDAAEGTDIANGLQEVQSVVPVDSQPFLALPAAGLRDLNSQERDQAISRYKEKKKTRR